MSDDEERITRTLQNLVDRERDKPIEIQLGDPGPYSLPRCQKVLKSYVRDQATFELELETEKRQRVRIPIDAQALIGLKLLVDSLVNLKNEK